MEVVLAFVEHCDIDVIPNNFQEYWSELWQPLTQQCLKVAKHNFILCKAFEVFKANMVRHQANVVRHQSRALTDWSQVFIDVEEEQILKALCKHVKVQEEDFMDYGLNRHRCRCRKYYTQKSPMYRISAQTQQ